MRIAFQRNVLQRLVAGGVLLFLMGGAGVGTAARAQGGAQPAPAAPVFGMVDVGKVLNESKSRQDAGAAIMQLQQRLLDILRRLDKGTARFLDEKEVAELGALYEKTTLTDAEKKRVGELEQKGDLASSQLTRLQNVPNPDPEQARMLTELMDRQTRGNEHLQKFAEALDKRLKDQERDINTKMLGEVRAAVAKVAKQKNLAAVFTGDVAIYAPVDITSDVLKEINK